MTTTYYLPASVPYAIRPVRPALRHFLRALFVFSLFALGFAAYFLGTLYYASVVELRILRGMNEGAVNRLCWLGTHRETPLAQTTLAVTSALAEGPSRVVVYRIGGFHPIEVVYSPEHKVLAALPAYDLGG